MKKSHHKLLIILAGGIFFLCLLLFLTPFLWESPVFLLLKSDKLNGYRKAGLIALYKPAPKQTIREYVHLYNGGYEPRDFTPGPVYIPEKGYNYQDSLGLLLTGDFYQEALPFRNGLGKIRQNTFYGMLNHRGRMVISPLYDTLVPFSEVIVLVQGREYGVANRRGKIIIPLLPRRISNTYHGRPLPFLMAVESDGSYSVIDGKGIKKKTRPFDSLDIRNNTYYICRDDKWGVLDEEGNELIPTLYDHIDVCDGDSFIVSNGGFEGLHLKGKAFPLVPIVYDKVDACTPATFIIMRDGHYGLLDRKAKPLIEPVYDTIYNHHPQEWIVTGDHGRYTLRNTGKLEYPTEFEIPFNLLKNSIQDIDIVSDKISLIVDQDKFTASAEGEFGEATIEYVHGEKIEDKAKSVFSLEKIKEMLKADKFSETAVLKLGNDMPLNLSLKMPADEGELSFLLAPRIESEE